MHFSGLEGSFREKDSISEKAKHTYIFFYDYTYIYISYVLSVENNVYTYSDLFIFKILFLNIKFLMKKRDFSVVSSTAVVVVIVVVV